MPGDDQAAQAREVRRRHGQRLPLDTLGKLIITIARPTFGAERARAPATSTCRALRSGLADTGCFRKDMAGHVLMMRERRYRSRIAAGHTPGARGRGTS